MDKSILDNTRQNAALDRIRNAFIEGDPGGDVVRRILRGPEGRSAAALAGARSRICARASSAITTAPRRIPPTQARIWSLREAALGLSMAMKEDAKSISFVEDTAVAPEKLQRLHRPLPAIDSASRNHGRNLRARLGGLPARAAGDQSEDRGGRAASSKPLRSEVADLVLEFGGALSGEHGDGLVRSPFMQQMFGDVLYEAFREIKRTFDPLGILNPGKIVDAPPITSNLRFGAGYRDAESARPGSTTPNTAAWAARSRCAAASARAARSSRAPCVRRTWRRARNRTPRAAAPTCCGWRWRDSSANRDSATKAFIEVLDLCLECRACKAECPVGVDMARFKSEFLADYWTRHGTPLRARALGNIHRSVGVGQPLRAALQLDGRERAGALAERKAARDRPRAGRRRLEARDVRALAGSEPAAATSRAEPRSRYSTTPSPITTIRRSASRRSRCWSAAAAA